MSSSPAFLDPIILPLIRGESVLDVGCGYGRWGCLIRFNFWEAGLKAPPVVDGIDGFLPNCENAAKLGVYRQVQCKLLPCELPQKAYDTVLASEIIEHLCQEDVTEFMIQIESAAKLRVILSTPAWKYIRSGGETLYGFNELEAHKSYISATFLKKRGYQIIGAGLGNPDRLQSRIAGAMIKLFDLEPRVFLSLSRKMYSLAHTIVAVKDLPPDDSWKKTLKRPE